MLGVPYSLGRNADDTVIQARATLDTFTEQKASQLIGEGS